MIFSSSLVLRAYSSDLRFQLQAEIGHKVILQFFPLIPLKTHSFYCKGEKKFTTKKLTHGLGVSSTIHFHDKKKKKKWTPNISQYYYNPLINCITSIMTAGHLICSQIGFHTSNITKRAIAIFSEINCSLWNKKICSRQWQISSTLKSANKSNNKNSVYIYLCFAPVSNRISSSPSVCANSFYQHL